MQGYFEFWHFLTAIFKKRKKSIKNLIEKNKMLGPVHVTIKTQQKDLENILT